MTIPDWPFWAWMLVGLGSGIIIFPAILGVFLLIRDTLERRKIKAMLKRGQFLQPIDVRDYDTNIWDKYLDLKKNEEKLKNLDESIFKNKEKPQIIEEKKND